MTSRSLTFLALIGPLFAQGLTVSTTVLQHSFCGRPTGQAMAEVSGGLPPYTYSWDIPSTEQIVGALLPGIYTVTVTDANLDQASAAAEILLLNAYPPYSLQANGPIHSYCDGGSAQVVVWSGLDAVGEDPDPSSIYGPSPYSFSHPSIVDFHQSAMCYNTWAPVYNILLFNEAPGTYLIVDFMDGAGCPGQMEVSIPYPFVPPMMQIVGTGASCQSGASGSVTVAVSGGYGQEFAAFARRVGQTVACAVAELPAFVYQGYTADGPNTINGLSAGDYYLVWTTDPNGLFENASLSYLGCMDSIPFTIPEIPGDCGSVSGRLYVDDDADCTMDFAENRIPNSIVTVEPGPYYLTTDGQGQYSAPLPFGNYTVQEQHPVFDQSCPAAFTIASSVPQTSNTGCTGGEPLDVMVDMASGPARPGWELEYALHVRNLTPASTGTVTLTMDFDPALSFISAYPVPSSVTGNTITWTDPQFTLTTVFQERHLWVHMQVPLDFGLVGTVLNATATLATQNADAVPANNSFVTGITVTASFDPNDKVAATSSRTSATQFLIDEDEWIDYTIRFQNTGTDTAFNVLVTDTLPSTLDPGSLLMGAASHTYTWNMSTDGVLRVSFNDILLPDSNVNEAASHGFFAFRIKPFLPLTPGTAIENTANIFFDFNPAVITEPSILTAEFSTGLAMGEEHGGVRVFPNPVHDELCVALPWNELPGLCIVRAADGREVMSFLPTAPTFFIDVHALPAGVYSLQTPRAAAVARFIKL